MGGIVDISSVSFTVYIAVIPSILLCLYIYYMDVVEKEPIRLLLTLFFVGILLTVPARFFEQLIISTTKLDYNNIKDSFFLSFFVIALVEEGYKFIALFASSWKNKEFNHKYDAIVYGVFISLGFATLENIEYIFNNEINIALYRGLISVPAHAFYAIAAGFFIGLAKEKSMRNEHKKKILYLLLALIVPIILHGTFDFLLLVENSVMFGIFFAFVIFLYLLSFFIINKTHDGKVFSIKK